MAERRETVEADRPAILKPAGVILNDGNHDTLLKPLSSWNHFLDALRFFLTLDADKDEIPDVSLLNLSNPTQKAPDSNPRLVRSKRTFNRIELATPYRGQAAPTPAP